MAHALHCSASGDPCASLCRPDNNRCGAPRLPDGGTSGCPQGTAAYLHDCACVMEGNSILGCEQPCDGAADAHCPTSMVCRASRASRVAGSFSIRCGDADIDTWTCQAR